MEKFRFGLLAVLLLSVFLAGCGGGAEEVVANPGQEVSLSIGQSVSIQGEGLKLKFLEVVNDSRCAKNVVCVWQGQASCLVEITYMELLHRLTLTQPGLTDEPSQLDFREYVIEFALAPYPVAGKEIGRDEYRLQLVVTKPALL